VHMFARPHERQIQGDGGARSSLGVLCLFLSGHEFVGDWTAAVATEGSRADLGAWRVLAALVFGAVGHRDYAGDFGGVERLACGRQ